MNALVRKEVRLLLPGWLAAAGVALGAGILGRLFGAPHFSLLLLAAGLLAAVASLGAFGREFSQGTFGGWLVLPASRSRLWWTKTLVLAGGLALLQALVWLAFHALAFRWPQLHEVARDYSFTPLHSALALAALFSGALWTTLVFRQVSAALWFTLFLPAALIVAGTWAAGFWTAEPAHHHRLAVALIVAYSIAGYLFAWRLFHAAEDLPVRSWELGHVSPGPDDTGAAGAAAAPAAERAAGRSRERHQRRQARPWTAMIAKELRLQRPVFQIAAGLGVLHLAALALRTWGGAWARQPLVSVALEEVWGLWLLVSMMAGAMAVAEERRLGLVDLQRVLPVSPRRHWGLKVLVVLTVSLVAGALPPWLLDTTSRLPTWGLSTDHPWGAYLPLLWLGPVHLGLALVALHASSLARNPLHALSLALAEGVFAVLVLQWLASPGRHAASAPWEGLGGLWIGVPTLALTLLALAAANSRSALPTTRHTLRNLAFVLLAIAGSAVLAASLHHRVWERLGPETVTRGPALWPASTPPVVQHAGIATVVAPDGQGTAFPTTFRLLLQMPGADRSAIVRTEEHAQLLPGRWRDLVASHTDVLGLQTNGTLWVTASPRPAWTRSGDPVQPFATMVQLGQDRDWVALRRDPMAGRSVLLLKANGSLWRWTALPDRRASPASFLDAQPRPLGADRRWTELHAAGARLYLRDDRGRYWVGNPIFRTRATESIQLDANLTLFSADDLTDGGLGWKQIAGYGLTDLLVREDGTLWTLEGLSGRRRVAGLHPLDASPDWIGVAADIRAGLGLRSDGSLWRIQLDAMGRLDLERVGPFRHWRSVAAAIDSLYALGDDGQLWRWSTGSTEIWGLAFAPSRRPVLAGQLPPPPR